MVISAGLQKLRIAYLILTHKLPKQVKILLDTIYSSEDVFLVHIDAKSSRDFHQKIRRHVAQRPNVFIMESTSVTWAGWSMCHVELEALRFLCTRMPDWDYLINLSGQDLPIQPIAGLRRFLADAKGTNFLDVRPVDDLPKKLRRVVRRRSRWLCLEGFGKARRLPIPIAPLVARYTRYYGSQWHMLSRPFCEWIVNGDRAARFKTRLRLTKVPDEFLLQGLIMESPFRDTLDPDNRRFFAFNGAPHPETLTMDHLEELNNSNAFFARKFDLKVDGEIVEEMRRRVAPSISASPDAAERSAMRP